VTLNGMSVIHLTIVSNHKKNYSHLEELTGVSEYLSHYLNKNTCLVHCEYN
jgi:hypothetical protein